MCGKCSRKAVVVDSKRRAKIRRTDVGRTGAGRNSSIELLKIVALLIIVIGHTVQTLTEPGSDLASRYIIDVSKATTNPTVFSLLVLRLFGVWGNDLFFICSAWFLLQKDRWKKQK